METKVCKTCGTELDLVHFTKWERKDGSFGYASECKFCKYERNNKYRAMQNRELSLRKYTNEELLKECRRRKLI